MLEPPGVVERINAALPANVRVAAQPPCTAPQRASSRP
jgi:hypothetical protein